MKLYSLLSALLASPFLVALLPACSHDHHDHEPQAQAAEPEPLRHLHFGKQLMLFLEHPPLVKSQSARFLAHFSVVESGEPVRAGRVQIFLGEKLFEVGKPARDGLFIPEGAGELAGKQKLRLILENGSLREDFDLGLVDVHESANLVPASAEDAVGDAVGFLLEQQWSVGLLVRAAGEGQVRTLREFPGVLEFDDSAKAFVSAGVGGLFVAMDGQSMPRVGDRILQGTQLGWIEALLSGNDAAQLSVWELEARLHEFDADDELYRARAQLELAEREQARTVSARERGLATQSQQDQAHTAAIEARLRLEAATLRQAVWKGRATLPSVFRIPLIAPISGVVSEWAAVPGALVEAGTRLAQLVNPERLRVRMRIPEDALGAVDRWHSLEISSVLLESDPVFVERQDLVLTAEVDSSTRTLAALLRPRNLPSAWKPGLLLSVAATETIRTAPVTVPTGALVMDQGMATVYVMLGGEQFQRRVVKLGSRDAQRVEILSGVTAGERVVTRGAHFVRLASMAPEGFGHGHAH